MSTVNGSHRPSAAEVASVLRARLPQRPMTVAEVAEITSASFDVVRNALKEVGARVDRRGPHGVVFWTLDRRAENLAPLLLGFGS